MDLIKSGRITDVSTNYRGWFIGSFTDQHPEFKNDNYEMKWSKMPKGYVSSPKDKIEASKSTLGILIYGKYELDFVGENKKVLLKNEGDYAFYNPNYPHKGSALEDSLLLTIRWPTK